MNFLIVVEISRGDNRCNKRQHLEDEDEDCDYEQLDDSDNDPDYLPQKPKPKAFRLLRKPRSLTRVTAKRNRERSKSERRAVVTIDEPNNDRPTADFNVASDICSTAAAHSTNTSKHSKGRVRRRTKLQQKAYAKTNHPMHDPCEGCKYDCSHNFDNSRRSAIWSSFWSQDYVGRKNWIFHTVERKPKKRKTAGDRSKRQFSFTYYLCNDDGVKIQVCKTFFLSTLGFHSKNDRFITTVMKTAKEAIFTSDSKRGKHPPANKKDTKVMKDHIMSFHPCVSHYRRAHAPNRLYLPSDITVKKMYNDFKVANLGFSCCYQTYRKTVVSLNISFTKLGEEQCETCLMYERNKHCHDDVNSLPSETQGAQTTNVQVDHASSSQPTEQIENVEVCNNVQPANVSDCAQCTAWKNHVDRAHEARANYRLEKQSEDTSVRSVDLQKVIMLPRIQGCKSVMFTRRLVVFNETFATVGCEEKGKIKRKNISVIWHEACAGRKAEEIASTMKMAIERERDMKHIIYWMDNCSGQNKNWCLFTTLVSVVNDPKLAVEDISLKYFEAGHTFMSADSVHHGVEKAMQGN